MNGNDRPLAGRVALISGGSGDLGGAIAGRLAAEGAGIAVGYLGNADAAAAVADRVRERGVPAACIALDQGDAASVEQAIEGTLGAFGRLDILVNNAAWNTPIAFPDLEAIDADLWDRMFGINVRGPYLLARAAARPMRAQGWGRIVNIASIAGLRPGGSSLAYAVSKAALIHLTRCLAVALGPAVLVNCVAPGLIEGTRMARRLPDDMADLLRSNSVLHRTVDAADVAEQVAVFCRGHSTTGQVLLVDAGVHFH